MPRRDWPRSPRRWPRPGPNCRCCCRRAPAGSRPAGCRRCSGRGRSSAAGRRPLPAASRGERSRRFPRSAQRAGRSALRPRARRPASWHSRSTARTACRRCAAPRPGPFAARGSLPARPGSRGDSRARGSGGSNRPPGSKPNSERRKPSLPRAEPWQAPVLQPARMKTGMTSRRKLTGRAAATSWTASGVAAVWPSYWAWSVVWPLAVG